MASTTTRTHRPHGMPRADSDDTPPAPKDAAPLAPGTHGFDADDAPVGIVSYRSLGRANGITIPMDVRRGLKRMDRVGWTVGDRIVVRLTENGNVIARRVRRQP